MPVLEIETDLSPRHAKLVEAYLRGETLKEIGRKLGVSEAQASRHLKKSKLN